MHLRAKVGTCDAFPGGIPKAIFMFGGDHRQPRVGDHGNRALHDWIADTVVVRDVGIRR